MFKHSIPTLRIGFAGVACGPLGCRRHFFQTRRRNLPASALKETNAEPATEKSKEPVEKLVQSHTQSGLAANELTIRRWPARFSCATRRIKPLPRFFYIAYTRDWSG